MKYPYSCPDSQSFDKSAWLYEFSKKDIHENLNNDFTLGTDSEGRPCLLKLVVNESRRPVLIHHTLTMAEYAYAFQLLINTHAGNMN